MKRACSDCLTHDEVTHYSLSNVYLCEWCSELRRVGVENEVPTRREFVVGALDDLLDAGDGFGAGAWLVTFAGGLLVSVLINVFVGWWMVWLVWLAVVLGVPAIIVGLRTYVLQRRDAAERRAALTARWDGWSGRRFR